MGLFLFGQKHTLSLEKIPIIKQSHHFLNDYQEIDKVKYSIYYARLQQALKINFLSVQTAKQTNVETPWLFHKKIDVCS